jgi:arsenate reductase
MRPEPKRARVLFLCTGNSCRSQMAEGWARTLLADRIEAHSAGTSPSRLDPRAVAVMAEAGVDISGQRAKRIADLETRRFELVVTVCDHARESCPLFPGAARTIHRAFPDPPDLARNARSEAEAREIYRRARDEIRRFVATLPEQV